MDVASVHRNLSQLEELGLVRHVHIGHGPGLYALVGADDREYIACEHCGQVTSVEPKKLDSVRSMIRRRFGYEARFTHFPILGLCRSCAREMRGERGGEPKKSAVRAHQGHEHEHSHGNYVHSHPHVHEKGVEDEHQHSHEG